MTAQHPTLSVLTLGLALAACSAACSGPDAREFTDGAEDGFAGAGAPALPDDGAQSLDDADGGVEEEDEGTLDVDSDADADAGSTGSQREDAEPEPDTGDGASDKGADQDGLAKRPIVLVSTGTGDTDFGQDFSAMEAARCECSAKREACDDNVRQRAVCLEGGFDNLGEDAQAFADCAGDLFRQVTDCFAQAACGTTERSACNALANSVDLACGPVPQELESIVTACEQVTVTDVQVIVPLGPPIQSAASFESFQGAAAGFSETMQVACGCAPDPEACLAAVEVQSACVAGERFPLSPEARRFDACIAEAGFSKANCLAQSQCDPVAMDACAEAAEAFTKRACGEPPAELVEVELACNL